MKRPQPNGMKDPRPEERVDAGTLEDLALVRRRAAAAGYPEPTVNGLIGWLVARKTNEPTSTSASAASKYRQILREAVILEPEPIPAGSGRQSAARAGGRRGRLKRQTDLVGVVAQERHLHTVKGSDDPGPPVILDPDGYVNQELSAAA